jgi:hypothetical protein
LTLLLTLAAAPRPAAELSYRDAQGRTQTLKRERGSTVELQFFNPG